jgi:TrmH family RNA methyltransferase
MADCETFPEDGVLALCPLREESGSVKEGSEGEEGLVGAFVDDADSDAKFINMPLDVALEGISDPGNLGTLLRCSAAVGMSRLWLTGDGHVDPYSPKVLRASAGFWFHVPVRQEKDIEALIARASRRPLGQVLACVPLRESVGGPEEQKTISYWDVNFRRPTLVLLGPRR